MLVARPRKAVAEVEAADLEQAWDGDVIFVTKREALGGEALRFGLAWFLPILKRFRHILAEILLISAFIQLVGPAAATPSI